MKKKLFVCLMAGIWGLSAFAQDRFVSEESLNRKILLEEYTGIYCGFCPDGHRIASRIAEKYPGDVFIMNVHAGSYSRPYGGDIDLRTPYGDSLLVQAGVTGFPAGSLNRHRFVDDNTAMDRSLWEIFASSVIDMPSYVNIAAKAQLDWSRRQLSVTVQLYYTGTPDADANFIHVAVLQDNIIGQQNGSSSNPAQVEDDGNYRHMHTFRDFLTGQWGHEVKNPEKGSFVEKTFTKTLPETIGNVDLDLLDLHFIAFVTETRDEVMNVCQAEVEHVDRPSFLLTIENIEQIEHISCDRNVRFRVTVKNNGLSSETISSITLNAAGKAGTYDAVCTLNTPIGPGEADVVVTDPIPLSMLNAKEEVTLSVSGVNGNQSFAEFGSQNTTEAIKYYGITSRPEITVDILQDRWGNDITWTLKNAEGETVAEDGPYETLPERGTERHTMNITLAEGCHTFTIYDKNGDGINNNAGSGSIRFSEADGKSFLEHDGVYEDSAVMTIRHSGVAVQKSALQEKALLYPNPASTFSTLRFSLSSETGLTLTVRSLDGRCLLPPIRKTMPAGEQEIVLPVQQLETGIYFVRLEGKGIGCTEKLIVIR